MELDDLKEKWKASSVPASMVDISEALEKKISALRNSGRGIRRAFYIEIVSAVLGFVVLFLFTLYVSDRMVTYIVKIIIVTFVGTIPVVWRLYKSQQWINSMDYSQDMRSNMVAFLRYYKITLKFYHWSTYLVIAVTIVLMFYDNDFMSLASKHRWRIIIYMLSVGAIATPYIWFMYGRRIAAFEQFLRD